MTSECGLALSDTQHEFLHKIGKPITLWNVFAGMGKSVLLGAAARLFIRHPLSDRQKRIAFACAPGNETCADLAAIMRRFFNANEVLHLRIVDSHDDRGYPEDFGMRW